ncbi:methylated-DNA--[protein]-cysteine S-methyltransferase [Pararhodospirillum oryzae]|uniref:methylated-DNA--[protein]-cysteine S-methyltransferase n=1 Tax=Pararhodospirillum oryzae TaxID=478448 RepID=A0A512H395_9PROT|nr:methylated-DNA--[protein]-cysteine S-methyltransferase [Pararhodospirillum oryzae]GEO79936.1 hypothetical protein ROR02_00670 [Pararhodospirillum oryzae]
MHASPAPAPLGEEGLAPQPLHDLVALRDPADEPRAPFALLVGEHETPFGRCLLALNGQGVLCHLSFLFSGGPLPDGEAARAALRARWPRATVHEAPEATAPVAAGLFHAPPGAPGTRRRVAVDGTPFQRRVWEALARIPPGCRVSYQTIANAIGQPAAVRAVGQAVGANPVTLVIPCHRVVRASGDLGGYYWGPALKQALLAWEEGQQGA